MSDATEHGGRPSSPGGEMERASGGSRPPVRIAGPAHRRPGSSRLKRRHVVSWVAIAVMVSYVLVQWCVSLIYDPAKRPDAWTAPPGTGSPAVTVTVTRTPSPSPSKRSPTRHSHPPAPQVTPHGRPSPRTHRPEPRPAPAEPPTARITAPAPDTEVSGGPGVLMTGTAAHLGGRELLIFDFAPNGVYYLASDGGPVAAADGIWSFRDATIGDGERDVGQSFVLTVVIADGACRATIDSTPRDAQNNIAYSTLPAGCERADSVRVIKTAP